MKCNYPNFAINEDCDLIDQNAFIAQCGDTIAQTMRLIARLMDHEFKTIPYIDLFSYKTYWKSLPQYQMGEIKRILFASNETKISWKVAQCLLAKAIIMFHDDKVVQKFCLDNHLHSVNIHHFSSKGMTCCSHSMYCRFSTWKTSHKGKKIGVIAFAGTQHYVDRWLMNMQCGTDTFYFDGENEDSPSRQAKQMDIRIHSGIYLSLINKNYPRKRGKSPLDVVRRFMKTVDHCYIGGYSIGGAMAAATSFILSDRIRSSDFPTVHVYSFGAPRFMAMENGLKHRLIHQIQSDKLHVYNVCNKYDIIPRIPLSSPTYPYNYVHISFDKCFYQLDLNNTNPRNSPAWHWLCVVQGIPDHMPHNYLCAVNHKNQPNQGAVSSMIRWVINLLPNKKSKNLN